MKVTNNVLAGTHVINYMAENPEDRKANAALLARYSGTGLVGVSSHDGNFLQLVIVARPLQEYAQPVPNQADTSNESGSLIREQAIDIQVTVCS
jgi:hypothetical protein